jgi:hypothetical protein
MVDEVLPFLFGPTFHNLKITMESFTLPIGLTVTLVNVRGVYGKDGFKTGTTYHQKERPTE